MKASAPVLVRLIDGQLVQSDAEAWRRETLARHVLALPSLLDRQEWLATFERKHGAGETATLKAAMTAIHQAGKPCLP